MRLQHLNATLATLNCQFKSETLFLPSVKLEFSVSGDNNRDYSLVIKHKHNIKDSFIKYIQYKS